MQSEQPTQKHESGIGALIGAIIIILLIIGGAFYLYAQIKNQVQSNTSQPEASVTTESLDAELQTIDTAELDAELKDIEAQF